MKILISGSCVSRDALEYLNPNFYDLVNYHARSSLATLTAEKMPSQYLTALENIPSIFQRRMVEYDFKHTFLDSIENLSFDVILMDLIDERFHLAIFDIKYRVTRSSEFLRANLKPNNLVNAHSDIFIQYWYEGADFLFKKLKELGQLHKVRMQKAFWSNVLDNGLKIEKYSEDDISKENAKLEKMYKYLEKYLAPEQFIKMPNEFYLIKHDHKWGISPFHFVDEYYQYLI